MNVGELSLTHEFRDGSPEAPVLVLLHGTGGGPGDLAGLAQWLSPEAAVLAPVGPVAENGAARWFRRLAEGVFDADDVVMRTHQVADFLLAAREHYGLAQRRLVAVGFSNGANIAAAMTLLRPDAVREAVLFASMLPVPEPPAHDLSGSRVLLSNGEQDPMAPVESANRMVEVFRERGVRVRENWHAGGHQVTLAGVEAAAEWLNPDSR